MLFRSVFNGVVFPSRRFNGELYFEGDICSNTRRKVSANRGLTPTINLGDDTLFCEGSSVIIEGGLAHRYLWSTGDTTAGIDVNNQGNYILTGYDSLGCYMRDTIWVVEQMNPLADFQITAAEDYVTLVLKKA